MTRKRTPARLVSVFLLQLLAATATAGSFGGAPLHSRCHSLRPVYTDSGRLLGYRSVCEVNRWDGNAPEPAEFASGWSVGPEVFESRKHWNAGVAMLGDSNRYREQTPFDAALDSDARQHAHRLHSHCVHRHHSLFSNLWTNLFGSSTSDPHNHHSDPYDQLPDHEHCQPKSVYGGASIFGSSRHQTIADPYTRHLLHKIHADRQHLAADPSDEVIRARLHHHLHKLSRHIDCHCHHQLPSSQRYKIHHVHRNSGGIGVLAVPHDVPQSMYPYATQIPLANAGHEHGNSLGLGPDYDGHDAMMLRMGAHAAQQSYNKGYLSPNDAASDYDRTVRMSVFHAAPYAGEPQSMYGTAATPLDDPLMSPPQTSYFQQPVPLADEGSIGYYNENAMAPYDPGYMHSDPQMAMYSQTMAAQAEQSRQAIMAYQQQLQMMQQQQMMQPSMVMEPMGMNMGGMGMGMMDEDYDSTYSRHHARKHRHKHRHHHHRRSIRVSSSSHSHSVHLKKLLKPSLRVEKIIVIKRLEVPVKVPVPMPYPVPMNTAAMNVAVPSPSAAMIDAGNPNALGAALLGGANGGMDIAQMTSMTPGRIGQGTYLIDGGANSSAGALYHTVTGMSCPCAMAASGGVGVGVHPLMAAGAGPLAAAAIHQHVLRSKRHRKRHKGAGKGFKKFLKMAKGVAMTGAEMYAMTNPAAAVALQTASESGALGHSGAGAGAGAAGANPLMMAAALKGKPALAAAEIGASVASSESASAPSHSAEEPSTPAAEAEAVPDKH